MNIMRRQRTLLVVGLIALLATGCGQKKQELPPSGLDWNAIADQIVRQSKLQPGEKVLLVASPGKFDSLVTILENKISKEGAQYLGAFSVDTVSSPEYWRTELVNSAKGKSRLDLAAHFGEVDLGIMLPGATPAHKAYAAMQDVLNMGKGRTIHFHWTGAYDLSGQPIELTSAMDKFYQSVLINTNYDSLKWIQQQFESAIRANGVHVATPGGTNLSFKIGDRPVTKQDGDASLERTQLARNLIDREIELPAGAIRVAPIEETVEGTIAFPDGIWNGQKVEGLILTFKRGKVTSITAKSGQEAVKAELDAAGDAGYSFREMAVGFNPLLAIPKDNPWIPYYGYGAGVVRLSLGDNTELGGIVSGPYVRWNFFTDATIVVGPDTWIDNGKLIR